MPETLTLGWRQYRLERRMFWRNPSAAFFNFVLPLLFLVAGGVILSGNQDALNKLVPSIAGVRVLRDRLATALGGADRVRARRRRQPGGTRRRLRARDPQLRVDRGVRQRGVPAGRVRVVLRLR